MFPFFKDSIDLADDRIKTLLKVSVALTVPALHIANAAMFICQTIANWTR